MAKEVSLNDLSADDRRKLMDELKEEQRAAEEKKNGDRAAYKLSQDEFLERHIPRLLELDASQKGVLANIFGEAEALKKLKADVFGKGDEQDSHTFTHSDGCSSFRIGYNTIIAFDGTQDTGISKVKEYIASLGADDARAKSITKALNILLKADKDGNLNPTRVNELSAWKDSENNDLLREGVEIIEKARVNTRTSLYVRGWCKVKDDEAETRVNFSFTIDRLK